MKIAIHKRDKSFSTRWIDYCEKNNIPYKLVNCYDSDIVNQMNDCDILLWHHHHTNKKDILFAKQLLFALQQSGKKVFPDFNTGWHFDDKLAQKYLFESMEIPCIKSYVFFDKTQALQWAESASYPKVFKLRGGAGSSNVKLIKDRSEAEQIIKKAFGKGFSNYSGWTNLKERYRKFTLGKVNAKEVFKGMIRILYPPLYSKIAGKEIGYAYFQDFIPNNDFDIRIVVVGSRAIGIKRNVRKGDFRASGSGFLEYSKEFFSQDVLKAAFETNEKLASQSTAFDYVFDRENKPLLVEISYGFAYAAYDKCEGYFDADLNWHDQKIDICECMLTDILTEFKAI